MKRIISVLISICIVTSCIPIAAYAAGRSSEGSLEEFSQEVIEIVNSEENRNVPIESAASRRVIVKAQGSIDTFNASDIASGFKDYYILEFESGEEAQRAVEYYNSQSNVKYARIDSVVTTSELNTEAEVTADSEYVPKSHLSQGSSDLSGFSALEKYLAESGTTYTQKLEVAVIDTGVEANHEFLSGRIEATEYNYSDSGEENSSADDNGHGTHVAGIIADNTPNSVVIKPYKVLNSEGKGVLSSVVLAVEQAIADGVDIINMSLGAKGDDEILHEAVIEAYNQNIPVVVSAGNDSVNIDTTKYSPASYEECITVAAAGKDYYGIPIWTNQGDVCDIYAPGVNIRSSWIDNSYKSESGTSMAAPYVSAAVAYIILHYGAVSPSEIEEILNEYSVPLGETPSRTGSSAHGCLYVEYITREIGLQLSAPTFSVESTDFEKDFYLTLTSDYEDAAIYYTIDGSSLLQIYSEPIKIRYTTDVSAFCFRKGMKRSETVTNTYTKFFTDDAESKFSISDAGMLTEYYLDEDEVVVPDTLRGITVTSVGDNVFKGKSATSIVLPETVTKFKGFAFAECPNLETVIAPGLNEIDSCCFMECPNLKEIDYSNVKDIPDGAFSGCSSLTTPDFGRIETIGESAFAGVQNIYSCVSDSVISVGAQAFYGTSIQVVILTGIEEIEESAFFDCTLLERVSIPNVTYIDNAAFVECINLKEFEAPSLCEIGDEVFYDCQSIEKFDFPSLINMYGGPFGNCVSLKEFSAPLLTEIWSFSFENCTVLNYLSLPKLETIYGNAFSESFVNYLNAPSLVTADDLPHADNSVVVVTDKLTECSYDAAGKSLTIQGVRNTYAQSYAEQYDLEFIEMDARGRSIRVTDAGLRFGFSFYDLQDKEVEEFGFLYSYENADEFDINTEGIKKKSAPNRITHEDGTTTFNLVFIGIPKSAYGQTVSARAYVCIDGIYFYSDILHGSFDEVAQLVLADEAIDQSTKDAVKNILNKEA